MAEQSTDAVMSTQSAQAAKRIAPARNFAARLFGYDVFISFALGPSPRGSLSYASDLARRLRERDFTVFFSEDDWYRNNQRLTRAVLERYLSRL